MRNDFFLKFLEVPWQGCFLEAVIKKELVVWDGPLLESAVDWLLSQSAPAKPGRPLDMGHVLVLMQTAQAGRRLREKLAGRVWKQNRRGVFPPRTGTPYLLVKPPLNQRAVATPMQCSLAWSRVLKEQDLRQWPSLFPRSEALRGASAQLALANSLESLRARLTDADLDCRAVVQSGKVDSSEVRRWEALADLEQLYQDELSNLGLTDPRVLQQEAASVGNVPEGVSRIVLLGVTDLSPLTQKALTHVPDGIDVQIVCFGETGTADTAFDQWGRPIPSYWQGRHLDLECIHVSADEAAQCQQVAEFIDGLGPEARTSVAIGVADANLAPTLQRALGDVGCDAYDPAGDPANKLGLHALLKSLLDWVRQKSFRHAEALVRYPAVQTVLGCTETTDLLHGLDLLRTRVLPATLADALAVKPLKLIPKGGSRWRQDDLDRARVEKAQFFLGRLDQRLKPFASDDLGSALKSFLDGMDLEPWANLHEFLQQALHELAGVGEGLDLALQFQMVMEHLGKLRTTDWHGSSAIELQGWLEMVWEDAPHLLLTGFQDSAVPESVAGDSFLPEALQVDLGLAGNDDRLARDVWQMDAILKTRKATGGRVDVLLGRKDGDGNPLLPSRLLFLCADSELPARVQHLFGDLPPAPSDPPWRAPWKLNPVSMARERLSVTQFKNYLDSPLMFFLKLGGSDEVDLDKSDLSPADFGTLLHAVLEKLQGGMDACTDSARIEVFLHEQLEAEIKPRFGKVNSALLKAQMESARKRLSVAAVKQAEIADADWRIHAVERKVEMDLQGITVRGYIDRIDHHEETGSWRLIDYKTSNTASEPERIHWGIVSKSSNLQDRPAWARFDHEDGKERAWKDLQLPLYVLAWKDKNQNSADVQAGYFNLPSSETISGYQGLPLSPDILDSARTCAKGVIQKVVEAQEFWPLRRKLQRYEDAYRRLFFHDVEATLEQPVVQAQETIHE